jgi:hypothetical protein
MMLALLAAASLAESLIALEKQSWEAWQKNDGAFFSRFLSDDHVEMGAGGPSTKQQVAAFVASKACAVKSYAVRDFRVTQLNASTAVVTYRAEQDTTCGPAKVPSPAWATSVYVLRGRRWQNALYQQTPIR